LLDLAFNNFTSDRKFGRQFFRALLQEAVEKINLQSGEIEISVNLVGEGKIKALNKKYRNKNKVTDVLSFPLDSNPALKGAIINLGDIFICLPFAKKQAKRENISIEEELSRLSIHGFLHLLGYDHERTEEDRWEMEKLEKKLIEN